LRLTVQSCGKNLPYAPTLPADLFAEQIEKSPPIADVEKYRFLPVAPGGQ